MSQSNVDIVKKAYAAFGQGNIPGVLETFSPDIEWHSPIGLYRLGGVHRGPEGVLNNFFSVLMELYDGLDVTPREYIEAGDRVIVLGNGRGKGRATGQEIDLPYVHIHEVHDGKITRFEEFEDTAIINRAFGQ